MWTYRLRPPPMTSLGTKRVNGNNYYNKVVEKIKNDWHSGTHLATMTVYEKYYNATLTRFY